MKWLHHIFEQFESKVQSGNSWLLIGIIMLVSGIICFAWWFKRNIVSDWAFEPIVEIPEKMQHEPFIKKWFNLTRGHHYTTKLKDGQSVSDSMKGPTNTDGVKMDGLFSGWAFVHCLQHFMIAFLCPKLVYFSFVYGIAWELFESINSSHCALDIIWNMCGCILGLLVRQLVFPI